MRIVFLGTPEFAVPSLQMLIEQDDEIVGVFTQPDRKKDRGHQMAMPPVKELALKHDLPVFQIEKIRSEEGAQMLKNLKPDLMISAAFGQIFSEENLETAPMGCINVHASLLPKYRGSAPIQWAIINGEKTTGVTIMYTSLGVDEGDMIHAKAIEILPDETAGELTRRLAVLGAVALKEAMQQLREGRAKRVTQDPAAASYYPMLKKETGRIDWHMAAEQIHNLVRGTSPWPGAYTVFGKENMKIWKTKVLDDSCEDAVPGQVLWADAKRGIAVCTGKNCITIEEVQMPGKKRMTAKAYANGGKIKAGMMLGQE